MSEHTSPNDVLEACKAAGLKVATAESCTGGMVCASLIDIAGSSAVVLGGIVAYGNRAKRDLLGVDAGTLNTHGAVSEPTAREMADGALSRLGADIAVSITGIAGPGGSATKPEGLVCFAVAAKGRETRVDTVEFGALGRQAVREASRDHALHMILSAT